MLLLLAYAFAWQLGDLRKQTVAFEVIFFMAFALYAVVTVLALRVQSLSRPLLVGVFVLAALMHGILVFTPPTLSDDMYRYVWEGRLQGHGFIPYRHPPNDPAVAHLRDEAIWPHVNRKKDVTVYPPAAEAAYALLWRIWPDSVRWFQIAMSLGSIGAGLLLLGLLRDLGLPEARVLIYLWSPLLIFETAHGAHVDGLVLPLLVGAWWARVRERDWTVGVLMGLATAAKIYPVILLAALWRPWHPQGRWRLPLAFVATVVACYAPYVLWGGTAVVGFLPKYFRERFNMGLASWLIPVFKQWGVDPNVGLLLLTVVSLGLCAGWMVWRPAPNGESAVRRCIWLIGIFTLLTQNLFSWYMLWLLPLLAIFLQPGRGLGLRVDAWSGWWLFSGLVMLSYTFFIDWKPLPVALAWEFMPLYLLLAWDGVRRLVPVGRSP